MIVILAEGWHAKPGKVKVQAMLWLCAPLSSHGNSLSNSASTSTSSESLQIGWTDFRRGGVSGGFCDRSLFLFFSRLLLFTQTNTSRALPGLFQRRAPKRARLVDITWRSKQHAPTTSIEAAQIESYSFHCLSYQIKVSASRWKNARQ